MQIFNEIPGELQPYINKLREMGASDLKDLVAPVVPPERNSKQGFEDGRFETLFDIISGSRNVEYYTALDIHLFCLKKLLKEEYFSVASKINLPYSKYGLYEFDPPKNGQNIIKHGISFREVVSFSKKFGAVSVPCPNNDDYERFVVFSDLCIDTGYELSVPLRSMDFNNEMYTMSIVQQRGDCFRFIRSNTFVKDGLRSTMKSSLKGIYPRENEKLEGFISLCCEKVISNLFSSSDVHNIAAVSR